MGNSPENSDSRSLRPGGSAGSDRLFLTVKRSITLIVVHCTATRADTDFTQADLLRCHRAAGMKMVGYHFYIRKDGRIWTTRPLHLVGAHARGYNATSIGIAYEGGLNAQGLPADTRTLRQKRSLRALIRTLRQAFPGARVCGHRDLSPDRNGNGRVEPGEWLKQCPCFEVEGDKWCH